MISTFVIGCGGSNPPLDSDGDGVADASDAFPNDATQSFDDDNDGVVNAYDYCLNSPAGSTVNERGCETNQVDAAGDAQGDGISPATVVFILAAGVVVYAVYSNARRPGPPLPKPETFPIPQRPSGMDEEA